MTKRKSTDPFRMPSPKDEMRMAMDHAVEKALLCHPQTQALRKQIAAEMQKAAGGASPKKPTGKKKP